MKKNSGMLVLLAVASLFAFVAAGCAPAPPAFKEFTSEEGGFSVKMRGDPKEETSDSSGMATTTYTSDLGDTAYAVAHLALDPSLLGGASSAQILDLMSSSLESAMGDVKITSSSDINLDGVPGKEFRLEGTFKDLTGTGEKDSFEGIAVLRIYLGDSGLYMVIYGAKTAQFSQADADTFFDSFKLTK